MIQQFYIIMHYALRKDRTDLLLSGPVPLTWCLTIIGIRENVLKFCRRNQQGERR
jgi:hypothetical protein